MSRRILFYFQPLKTTYYIYIHMYTSYEAAWKLLTVPEEDPEKIMTEKKPP